MVIRDLRLNSEVGGVISSTGKNSGEKGPLMEKEGPSRQNRLRGEEKLSWRTKGSRGGNQSEGWGGGKQTRLTR